MKVLTVHNFYQQAGGEDQVFANDAALLEAAGHTVLRLTETNDRVAQMGRLSLAAATVWNGEAYRRVHAIVSAERPDVVHFHNTFPLLSPACYYAARRGGAAVVQTLHNFRLICPGPNLLRNGRPCEDCVGKVPWRAVQHACYRESRVATAGVAAMLTFHRAAGTWQNAVDAYIALTEFSRSRFIAGGLPSTRLFTKPNFTAPDPGPGKGGDGLVYVGRLSSEKGLDVLLDAWRGAGDMMPRLKIMGDGPLAPWLREQLPGLPRVEWLGRLPREQVIAQMQNALALVLPSICYENFPLTVVEAYATGLPVIASALGAVEELVHDQETGLTFRPGDALDLRQKVLRFAGEPQAVFRANSRREYDKCYGPDANYELLLDIYRRAIEIRRATK